MRSHEQLMAALAERHRPLVPFLSGADLHYLDIPFYDNVGDLLIMLGTEE